VRALTSSSSRCRPKCFGMLARSDDGLYANTRDTDLFLDREKPSYLGGLLEMANARLYRSVGG
jgi:hypothetical protein